jgi:hypothetical protein
LAHACLCWEYSCKGLKLAQLLGQLGVFLTWASPLLAALLPRSMFVLRAIDSTYAART